MRGGHTQRGYESELGYGLTPAEDGVVRLLMDGADTQEMREKLNISYNTLSRHLWHIFNKTGCDSRVAVAVKFLHQVHAKELQELKGTK